MEQVRDVIGWMDAHNGVLLLVVTTAYVIITGRMAKQGKDSATESAAATKAAQASSSSAETTATATQHAAEAARESAAAAAATAHSLAAAVDTLRAMVPVQFQVRMVPVLDRGLTLEIQCAVATLHVHAVRLTRTSYPTPVRGLPTRPPLAEPIALEPTSREHELPRMLHPGEVLLASTSRVHAGYLDFVSVELDYTLGSHDEPIQTYRLPVEGFASSG